MTARNGAGRTEILAMDDALLTPAEVAKRLGVQEATLTVWRSRKRYALRYVKVGARVMYDRTDVERFIDSRRVEPLAVEGATP